MKRRDLLKLAGAAGLAAPAIASAQGTQTLRFVPISDLALVDPVANTAAVTRNHAYLVWTRCTGSTMPTACSRRCWKGIWRRRTIRSGR